MSVFLRFDNQVSCQFDCSKRASRRPSSLSLVVTQCATTGTVTVLPKADLMVAVGLGDGPLPTVVTAIRQRAPVGVRVKVAVPRFTVPVVVVAVAVMVLPVPREVVPDRTQ
ncbi:hypothetical protein D3C85_1322580 [compost metagenome]